VQLEFEVQIVAQKSRGQKLFKPIGTARVVGAEVEIDLSAIPALRSLYIPGLKISENRRRGFPVVASSPAGEVNLGRALLSQNGNGTNLLLDAVPRDLKMRIRGDGR